MKRHSQPLTEAEEKTRKLGEHVNELAARERDASNSIGKRSSSRGSMKRRKRRASFSATALSSLKSK
jgi:hypothetical protein